MRVGIYCGRHAGHGGGIAVYARGLLENYAKSLSDSGEHDELFVYAESTVLDEKLLEQFRVSGLLARSSAPRIVLRRLPSFAGRKAGLLLDQILLPFWVKSDHVDVLHSTSNFGILAATPKQLITVHDLFQGWPLGEQSASVQSRAVRGVYRFLFRRQFADSARIITDCPSVSLEIAEKFGKSQSSMTVVPLGIDNALAGFLSRAAAENLAESSAGWLSERNIAPGYVLVFASTDPRKNLDRTLDAWLALPESLRRAGLVIRPLEAEAAERARKRLAHRPDSPIHYLGWLSREELFMLYLGARAVLVPTLAEGYGLPAVEALALGSAVVCPPIDCLANRQDAEVFACDPSSVTSIADALTRCLAKHSARPAGELIPSRLEEINSRPIPPGLRATAESTYALYRKQQKAGA